MAVRTSDRVWSACSFARSLPGVQDGQQVVLVRDELGAARAQGSEHLVEGLGDEMP